MAISMASAVRTMTTNTDSPGQQAEDRNASKQEQLAESEVDKTVIILDARDDDDDHELELVGRPVSAGQKNEQDDNDGTDSDQVSPERKRPRRSSLKFPRFSFPDVEPRDEEHDNETEPVRKHFSEEIEPIATRQRRNNEQDDNDVEPRDEEHDNETEPVRKHFSEEIELIATRQRPVRERRRPSGTSQLHTDAWLLGTDGLQAASNTQEAFSGDLGQSLDDSISGTRRAAGGAAAAAASLSYWLPWGDNSSSESTESIPLDRVSEGSVLPNSSGGAASAWLPWLDRQGKQGSTLDSKQGSLLGSKQGSRQGSKQGSRQGSKQGSQRVSETPVEAPAKDDDLVPAPVEAPTKDDDLVPAPENAPDCPICFEAISPGEAAMRCTGVAGMQHYFHRCCLSAWIKTTISAKSPPTCPVCRGAIQVNVARLESFLASGEADHLLGPDRTVLEHLLARAKATLVTSSTRDDWAEPFTAEDALNASVVGLALSAGFMAGFSDEVVDDLLVLTASELSTSPVVQVANSIGYVAGVTSHFASEVL